MTRLSEILHDLMERGIEAALVRVATAQGSAPREAGATMLVTAEDCFGTIGGGKLEWEAIAAARRMLETGAESAAMALPLGPALGQCCGGRVTLAIARADAGTLAALQAGERAADRARPTVLLFGAGHVGRALATALAPLPLALTWIDGRTDAFPKAPPPGIAIRHSENPVAEVAAAPARAAYLVMTHSHALDFDIVEAVLRRGDFVYAGLIGSTTKRRRFRGRFVGRGGDAARFARLTCPIGGVGLRDKRPEVIAALAAAEVLGPLLGEHAAADEQGRQAWEAR